MADRNDELVHRLADHPEVVGILCHGSFSENPLHESDSGSDLDLTLIIDSKRAKAPGRAFVPWINFKSYQAMPDGKPLEVDLYYFDVNDTTPWDIRTREGYSHSVSVVYDPDGVCRNWLNRKVDLLPEMWEDNIIKLMIEIRTKLNTIYEVGSDIDQRIEMANVVKMLQECIYWINWKYPMDTKWRFSHINQLKKWKPDHYFVKFANMSQTKKMEEAIREAHKVYQEIESYLESEGFDFSKALVSNETGAKKEKLSRRLQLERLWTRLDNYSDHTPQKCIKRLLPWNGHDIVWSGVINAIDLIYVLNHEEIPATNKFAGLSKLAWQPRNMKSLLYLATFVYDYSSGNSVDKRATALRELFDELTEKVREEGLFKMGSLYSGDFINQPLFGEDAIFTHMFREGGYVNRQQTEDTYAVQLLRRVTLDRNFDENMLWGLCNQYFVANDEELIALAGQDIDPVYKDVLAKVIPQLN